VKPISVRDNRHREVLAKSAVRARFKAHLASLPQEKRIELLRGLIAEAERKRMPKARADIEKMLDACTEGP
jgi:hypothetical protein